MFRKRKSRIQVETVILMRHNITANGNHETAKAHIGASQILQYHLTVCVVSDYKARITKQSIL